MFSTKECLEDVIGSLSNLCKNSNANPFKQASPERLFLHHLLSIRWETTEFPLLRVQPGDMLSKSFYSTSRQRAKVFLPRHFRTHPSSVVSQVAQEVNSETTGNFPCVWVGFLTFCAAFRTFLQVTLWLLGLLHVLLPRSFGSEACRITIWPCVLQACIAGGRLEECCMHGSLATPQQVWFCQCFWDMVRRLFATGASLSRQEPWSSDFWEHLCVPWVSLCCSNPLGSARSTRRCLWGVAGGKECGRG